MEQLEVDPRMTSSDPGKYTCSDSHYLYSFIVNE